jgi:predicted kinase
MPAPILIVLRGNSGSGKSTLARALRAHLGYGLAWALQDDLRRTLLREPDLPGGATIGLIELTARHALAHGGHVMLDGILDAGRYGEMLARLAGDCTPSHWYSFDLPFEETLRRHAGRPQAADFGEAEMQAWDRPRDLLPGVQETVIAPETSLEAALAQVLSATGLRPSATTPAPR